MGIQFEWFVFVVEFRFVRLVYFVVMLMVGCLVDMGQIEVYFMDEVEMWGEDDVVVVVSLI